jgi:hypothetical protein
MSYTAAKSRPAFTFDALLEMKDAGLIAASAAAQVDAAAKVLVATGDESYKIAWEVSDNSGFSSGVEYEVCALTLGDATVHGGDTDSTTGRYVLPIHNRIEATPYRYGRVYVTVAGTVATGINFTAFVAPK